MLVRVAPGFFPPDLVVQVKALACELPAQQGRPLSRWSTTDLVQEVQRSGLVASSHRGVRAVDRLRGRYPRLTLVPAPVHASWLNQIEIYFSIVQRKVLTPNDFPDLNAVAERLLDFQYYWETTARPFEWKFTRQDLADLLAKTNPPR